MSHSSKYMSKHGKPCASVPRRADIYRWSITAWTFRPSTVPSQAGDKLPDATVYEGKPDNKVKVRDVFKGKKGVLFGVPGKPEPLFALLHLSPEQSHVHACACPTKWHLGKSDQGCQAASDRPNVMPV